MSNGPGESDRHDVDLLIVGAGPCGLAAAISAQRAGLRARVLDSAAIASTITQYPYYVKFFSTAEKLALGGMPFLVSDDKPTRREGLTYYRAVVRHFGLDVRQYERVHRLEQSERGWLVHSESMEGQRHRTAARAVCVATGYFGSPNLLGVPGESLPHVAHVYREGHGAYDQDVVVVGGGNSAAEATLDLWRTGARVTLVHFGPTFDKKIKPWVLRDVDRAGMRDDPRAGGRGAARRPVRVRDDRLRAEHRAAGGGRRADRSGDGDPAARSDDARDDGARAVH